jgi:hypothetical protein
MGGRLVRESLIEDGIIRVDDVDNNCIGEWARMIIANPRKWESASQRSSEPKWCFILEVLECNLNTVRWDKGVVQTERRDDTCEGNQD